jgi:hypothetical protein
MKRLAFPALLLLAFLCPNRPLHAQEAEVRDAVQKTVAAWNNGAIDEFRSNFLPQVQGFYLDGGVLMEGMGPVAEDKAAYAAGFKPNVVARQITIRIYGNTAVIAAYFTGAIKLPGNQQLVGPWRFTETRIKDSGKWKTVQWHFSRLAPQA